MDRFILFALMIVMAIIGLAAERLMHQQRMVKREVPIEKKSIHKI